MSKFIRHLLAYILHNIMQLVSGKKNQEYKYNLTYEKKHLSRDLFCRMNNKQFDSVDNSKSVCKIKFNFLL